MIWKERAFDYGNRERQRGEALHIHGIFSFFFRGAARDFVTSGEKRRVLVSSDGDIVVR